VRVGPEAGKPKSIAGPELIGRDDACSMVQVLARSNCNKRGSDNHADHTFLFGLGHVRIGKTRICEEVPHIIDQMREETWLPAAYLEVDFLNGVKYQKQIDGAASSDLGVALGGRLAHAMGALYRGDVKTPFKKLHLDELRSADTDIVTVITAFVRQRLEGAPSNAVLPIVVHFDEHGLFVNAAKKNNQSEDIFEEMLYEIGAELMVGKELPKDVRQRFFVVPVSSGTSYSCARLKVSTYSVEYFPLRLLTLAESEKLARGFWQRRPNDNTAFPLDDAAQAPFFRMALSDCGGMPGLVEMLCSADATTIKNKSFARHLHKRVISYSARRPDSPGFGLGAEVVRCVLAKVPMGEDATLKFTSADGNKESRKVLDLMDSGYVYAEEVPGSTSYYYFSVSAALFRDWLNLKSGIFNLDCLGDVSPSQPWTWQQFEIFHANFIAARLAALNHHKARFPTGLSLRNVLVGAQPANAAVLALPFEPADVVASSIVRDKRQCISREPGCKDAVSSNASQVHHTAPNTLLVDAYVNVNVMTKKPTTLFFQYKHSNLEVDGVVTVSLMNKARANLTDKLSYRSKYWSERDTVLVYVTNRRVDCDTSPADGLVWISKDELTEHLGDLFAGRGLLPPETPRQVRRSPDIILLEIRTQGPREARLARGGDRDRTRQNRLHQTHRPQAQGAAHRQGPQAHRFVVFYIWAKINANVLLRS
jgi:hypothetical protein